MSGRGSPACVTSGQWPAPGGQVCGGCQPIIDNVYKSWEKEANANWNLHMTEWIRNSMRSGVKHWDDLAWGDQYLWPQLFVRNWNIPPPLMLWLLGSDCPSAPVTQGQTPGVDIIQFLLTIIMMHMHTPHLSDLPYNDKHPATFEVGSQSYIWWDIGEI